MTIEVTNTYCKIVNALTIEQLGVIQNMCSFKVEGSDFKANAFRGKGRRGGFEWDGYKKLFNAQTRKFPIGLLELVTSELRKYGVTFEIVNKRKYITDVIPYELNQGAVSSRKYQDEAIFNSIVNGNGIIKAATGAGKTVIAGRTIGALGKRTVFIVHTRDLLYQTKESFQRIFPNETIGQIGDGVLDYQNITIATMQTLAKLGSIEIKSYKYDEDKSSEKEKEIEATKQIIEQFHIYRNSIACVMMDEVQIVCSQTAFAVRFLFEKANYAFGYSASPWRDDGSDLMIEAAFGKRIVDINASMLIKQGYLVKPIISIIKNESNVYSGKKYDEVYKSAIVENMYRNMMVINRALMHYELGRNTLILVTLLKHGEILKNMLSSVGVEAQFISGKSGMKNRTKAIKDMREGKIQLLIASTIADVGLDIPRLQSLVEAGAGKSSVTALQRLGRIMRIYEGKTECYFDTFKDTVPYISEHIKHKINIWSTEPEFVIREED